MAAVALGVTLALRYLRGGRLPVVGVVHGLMGATGLVLLVVALQGPRRGVAMGVGSFGVVAAVLFGIALTLGPFVPLLTKRVPRAAGVVLAAHASIAITAFVLFLAWTSMG
jgi:hypothetical protein